MAEDIEIIKAKLEVAEAKRFSKNRLYKYGLSSEDINIMCNYETLPQDVKNQHPVVIQRLNAGQFGYADKITYKGKDYVRKTQNINVDEAIGELFGFSREFSPFMNEIQVLKQLANDSKLHKYVPVYYGFSMNGNKGTFIMELLNGLTLQEVCVKRGLRPKREDDPNDEGEWQPVMSQITAMLMDLHKAGYVFNDLHSENIFVLMDGTNIKSVVLIDFGLTRSLNKEKEEDFKFLKKQAEKLRFTPNPTRNIPELNWQYFKEMKAILENPYQTKCIRNPDANFAPIQYKKRDFETENTLNAEQKAELDAMDKEISDLKIKIKRREPIMPSLAFFSEAKQTIEEKTKPKTLGKTFRKTIRNYLLKKKGGKRKNKKTRKLRV